MVGFTKGPGTLRQPFGSREFRRSTRNELSRPYTLSAASVPTEVIDGSTQKMVYPGEVLAKITSTAEAGKVGVFQAGAADGRAVLTNIVGLCITWLPWQLLERDAEVAAMYGGVAVQAWCSERDAGGLRIPLTNTTAAAMVAQKTLNMLFE